MAISYSKIFLIILLIIIIFLRPILAILTQLKVISQKTYKSLTSTMKPVEGYKNFSTFQENNVKDSISSIFKYNNLNYNLDSYPNLEVTATQTFFKDNKFLPECCRYNNEYSSSTGCPCITPEQYFYLENRTNTNRQINNHEPMFSPTNQFKKPNIILDNSTDYTLDPTKLSDTSINSIMSTLRIDTSEKQEPSITHQGESSIVIKKQPEQQENKLARFLDQYGINSIVHKWI